MNEQNAIQHALKFLAECEYDQRPATDEALAAGVGVSAQEMGRLLGDMRTADLIEPATLKLTPTGREFAMHVLRAHRLYETYLARKTGVSEKSWHTQAHIKEHELSKSDVEKLAQELDYPRFDPHGDPIPDATGAMAPKQGQALTEYPEGWEGRVVHVEDHPTRLFAQIASVSIAPGTVLRIARKSGEGLRVQTEGCTFDFSIEVAGQITVTPLVSGETFDEGLVRLSSLVEDEAAAIVGLSPLCRGLERSRLLDLGFVPGSRVTVDLVSPAGSPVAYRIRAASIALRREQTERILIRKEPG